MKRVVIYSRVSTDKQTVDNQLDTLREVSERNGWSIVGEYSDIGISGSLGRKDRKQFDELLKDGNRKKYDCILVWSIDRLGRSLTDLVSFLNDIQSKYIDIYIHQQGLDTSTSTGKMMFQMCSVFAEFERSIIRERIKSGMQRVKRTGTRSGKTVGRQTNVNSHTRGLVIGLRETGMSFGKISRELGIGVGTIYKLLEQTR
jgi:DNA invertase Pin-like site-specific DNA recombinase